jgi:hypothetical protein
VRPGPALPGESSERPAWSPSHLSVLRAASRCPRSRPAEFGRVLPAEVEREREEQSSCPDVHWVADERLMIADVVCDEPDDEPDECHRRASFRLLVSTIHKRGSLAIGSGTESRCGKAAGTSRLPPLGSRRAPSLGPQRAMKRWRAACPIADPDWDPLSVEGVDASRRDRAPSCLAPRVSFPAA